MPTRQAVSSDQLRKHLPAYLRLVVNEGVEILVLRYDQPIAVLSPLNTHPRRQELIDNRLEALGYGSASLELPVGKPTEDANRVFSSDVGSP